MSEPAEFPQKIAEAVRATEDFIVFLDEEKYGWWADKFRQLLEYLNANDAKAALNLRKSFQYGGMGSLSDIMVDRQDEFYRLWGAQGRAMDKIYLLIEFGVDRK